MRGDGERGSDRRWRSRARRVLPSRSCPAPKWIGSRPVTSARTTDIPAARTSGVVMSTMIASCPARASVATTAASSTSALVSRLPDGRGQRAGLRAEEGEGGAAVGEGVPARMIRRGADGLRRTDAPPVRPSARAAPARPQGRPARRRGAGRGRSRGRSGQSAACPRSSCARARTTGTPVVVVRSCAVRVTPRAA